MTNSDSPLYGHDFGLLHRPEVAAQPRHLLLPIVAAMAEEADISFCEAVRMFGH